MYRFLRGESIPPHVKFTNIRKEKSYKTKMIYIIIIVFIFKITIKNFKIYVTNREKKTKKIV